MNGADVDGTDGFQVGDVRRFTGPDMFSSVSFSTTSGGRYDVADDGRLLMAAQAEEEEDERPSLILVRTSWTS